MSEGFNIPSEVTSQIAKMFPESNNRRVIAGQLMLWDRKPNSKEQTEIGGTVGVSRTTVNSVINKLSEHGLFTKELGSIPLYKATTKIELNNSLVLPPVGTVGVLPLTEPVAEAPKPIIDTPESHEEQPPKPVEPTVKPPMRASQASRADLESRLDGFKGTLKTMEAKSAAEFLEVKEMISRLSFTPPSGPPNSPEPAPVVEAIPVVPREELTMEERLVELEQRLQTPEEPTDPLADLSAEQMRDLLRSQPKELLAMANPGNPKNQGGRIQATEVTLRPIIVMMTTYTQMLFEKIVHDGYFEGTLSDFLNFTAEQYFTDRGWSLDWNRREPANVGRRRLE